MILTGIFIFCSIMCIGSSPSGKFRLARYYQNNMVLQRAPNKAIVWGYSEQNASVSLSLFEKIYNVTGEHVDWSDSYVWRVTLDPISTNNSANIDITHTTSDGVITRITLENILFGDVW
jgi:sialate O-acetylesterase